MWKVKIHKKKKLKKPVLIEGLPGIGNVGKIVVDYMIDQLNADLIRTYFSYDLPNTVFVNEQNLVELPRMMVYHKRIRGQDFIFLAGDVQPKGERSSFEFAEQLLNETRKIGLREIITLGGVGYAEPPETIKVYCTGNNKDLIKTFDAEKDIYGVVGPIIGLTGLLIGMSTEKGVKAACLLAETYNHPMYLGIKEAKKILEVLEHKYSLGLSFDKIDEEINKEEVKETPQINETSYIG